MNTAQLYTLARDVDFVAVETLSEQTRKNFHYAEREVVITHHNTRKQSKIIAQDAADLLQRFRTPLSWPAAILQHALSTKRDPQQLAEESFALLVSMQEEGFLVVEEKLQEQPAFFVGKSFRQYRIKETLRELEDSAVYRIEGPTGTSFALKTFNAEKEKLPPNTFLNEAVILKKLDGTINPRLIEEGAEEGVYFLVLQWRNGETCNKAAARHRNYNVLNNALGAMDLCLAILKAYTQLHQQGILHGDVHPTNILVDENNNVSIVDYGFSAPAGTEHRTLRGGLHFYYEPELATALLNEKDPPPTTEKSEQYALAVLLFHLLSGEHYLPFSYEPEKAYRQILSETPLPFSAFDLNLPPVFDEVFRVALAKDPYGRFPSLQDFCFALERCRNAVLKAPHFFVSGKKDAEKKFIRFLTRKYGWDSPLLKRGLSVPPTASVNDGAAGIAYLFYRMACVQQDAPLLALANAWANRAANDTNDYSKAFFYANSQTPDNTVGRSSLHHSPTGVHLVQALVSSCGGDRYSFRRAVNEYLVAASVSSDLLDLTTGKAGLLVGGAVLLRELEIIAPQETTELTAFTNSAMQNLWQTLDASPGVSHPNPVAYFGVAHGWGGLLYATALWCKASGSSLPTGFYNRMEELLAQGIKEKNTLRWPLSANDKRSWPGWCHGQAGYVFLWSLLYELLNEDRLLAIAEQCATSLHPDSHQAAHLCCGMAGQAYALLKLHRLTGEKQHWKKLELVKHAILHQLSSAGLRNNSLYKGEVGIGVLLTELQRPELARMPLFE